MQNISPQRLKEEIEKGSIVEIVDLQIPHEYEHSHIPGAINIEFDKFENDYSSVLKDKDTIIVLYGEFDELGKGEKAGGILENNGYKRVGRLEGGLMGWKDAGFHTEGGIES